MEKGLAIVTGADGGMGQIITTALARAGYPVMMACQDPAKATLVRDRIRKETTMQPQLFTCLFRPMQTM